jgi:magnesium transporter
VKQLQEKTSLVSKKMDAAYLMFLLLADVINSIEPLLNMYGDALEGLDFLFDEYEPTVRRNLMSRRMQKDLWVIRRWGWLMSTTAQDLAVDPWDVFTEEQEKPIQMLLQQSNTLMTAAKAYLEKAESQENFYSRTQEQCTNNLLFNLTICTLIMVPPQFFTGLYGMNFDVLPELHNENSYFALWGWCVL